MWLVSNTPVSAHKHPYSDGSPEKEEQLCPDLLALRSKHSVCFTSLQSSSGVHRQTLCCVPRCCAVLSLHSGSDRTAAEMSQHPVTSGLQGSSSAHKDQPFVENQRCCLGAESSSLLTPWCWRDERSHQTERLETLDG